MKKSFVLTRKMTSFFSQFETFDTILNMAIANQNEIT